MNKKLIPFLFLLSIIVPAPATGAGAAGGTAATVKVVRGTHPPASAGNSRPPLNMVLIPEGDVVLGLGKDLVKDLGQGQPDTVKILSASLPRHNVRGVKPFYCDKYEVTNIQWKAFLDATGREPSKILRRFAWAKGPDGGMSYPEGEDKLPIRNVDFSEAREFASWCGKRLPTETEWMRAASGDDGRLYAWGDKWDPKLCAIKDRRTRRPKLMPVGSIPKGASAFGIMDMTGGVWEWTRSPFDSFERFKPLSIKVGSKTIVLDPRFDAREYVLKGGAFFGNNITNLLAVRQPALPNTSLDSLGFRCVKSTVPGEDVFRNAIRHVTSEYLSENKWDRQNRFAVEVTEIDPQREIIARFDYLLFAPVAGILTSISKIVNNATQVGEAGYFPLGLLSVSRPLEEPDLPAGSYTLVYRQKGAGKEKKKPVANVEKKKEKPAATTGKKTAKKKGEKKTGGEEGKKTPEEIKKEEEEKRIAEENRKAKAKADAENARAKKALEKIGAVVSTTESIDFPTSKNLVLFLNRTDAVVGYVPVEQFKEGGEEPIRVVNVESSGETVIEFTVRILGSKHPRFTLPIKIKNNPFK